MERTVPFGVICLSLTILWYAMSGHSAADTAERRARSRWYTTKTEQSFEDMVIKPDLAIGRRGPEWPDPVRPVRGGASRC
ncbi:hypothetical protein [Nonomuraea insulae]|uniref:Secreted protein n=1 Tax=Nonomuraea insulae TaxID=1616787 RepID=A0ABW1CHN2_9ACTN